MADSFYTAYHINQEFLYGKTLMTKREILLASISGLLMSLAFPNLNLVYFLDLPYSADYRSFQKQSGKKDLSWAPSPAHSFTRA